MDPDGRSPALIAGAIVVGVGLFLLSDYANAPAPGQQPTVMSTGQRVGAVANVLLLGAGARGALAKEADVAIGPKAGSAGSDGAKKAFSNKVKDQARAESNDRCVLCGTKTTREPGPTSSEIDHAIPKSRGGNNTLENAQNTCRACNRQKGAKTTDEFLNR